MKNRLFKGTPTTRLIVAVEISVVGEIDRLMKTTGLAGRNRSEFVRLAIEAALARHRDFDDFTYP